MFGEIEQFSVVSCVYDEDHLLSKKPPVVGKNTVIEVLRASSAMIDDEESKDGDQEGGMAEIEKMLGELSLGRGLDSG